MKTLYTKKIVKLLFLLIITVFASLASNSQVQTKDLDFISLNRGSDENDAVYFLVGTSCETVTSISAELIFEDYDFDPFIVNIETSDGTVFPLGPSYNVGGSVYINDTLSEPGGQWIIRVSEPRDYLAQGTKATVRFSYELSQPALQAKCKDVTIAIDENGVVYLDPAQIDNGSEGCGLKMGVSESAFDCTELGDNTVNLIVRDYKKDVDVCTSTVTVIDTILPECEDFSIQLDENGSAVLNEKYLQLPDLHGSSDNCGISNTISAATVYSCADIGEHTANYRIFDRAGNTVVCTSTVTVEDKMAPTVVCKNISVQLDENGLATIDASDVDNGSSDNCEIASMTVSKEQFDCSGLGTNDVILTVTDVSGNSNTCTAVVTVEDNTKPTASCKDVTVELDHNGNATISATDIDDTSTDNCSIESMATSATDFDCSDLGDNLVTLTVTDPSGNSASCQSTVTIVDKEAPVIQCQETDVYLQSSGRYFLNQADIDRIVMKGTGSEPVDNCTSIESLAWEITPRTFECVHADKNIPVTVKATDASGNTAECQTIIHVLDTVAPVMSCVGSVDIYLDENGNANLTVDAVNGGNNAADIPDWAHTYNNMENGGYDACGIENAWLDISSFSCQDGGANTVTLWMSDSNGNENWCTTTVNVLDTIPFSAEPVEDVEVNLSAGKCETTIDYPDIVVSDNCNITLEQTEGLGPDGVYPAGTTTETWTATDVDGSTETISFNVVVTTENLPPTIDAIDNVSLEKNETAINVPLTGISSGNDCVEQDLTITATAGNTELVPAILVNYEPGDNAGSLNITTAPGITGETEITVQVEDSEGELISETFIISTSATNQPPFVVNPVADQMVNASYVLKVPLSSVPGELFDDNDDESLLIELIPEGGGALPVWATYTNDTLTATPMIADTGCVSFVVVATDAAGTSATDTFQVCVEGYPSGTNEIDADLYGIRLYPNPSKGIVNIDFATYHVQELELSVIDITGRVILQQHFSNSQHIAIDIQKKVSGIYFIKLGLEGKQIIKKLILDKH